MTDLVERLRLRTTLFGDPDTICHEAAAEIERLRKLNADRDAAMKRLEQHCLRNGVPLLES